VSRSAAAPAAAADEPRLAQRAAAGDGDAFAELYGRYEQRVFNLCYRILGTQDDAADATQEAFAGVFKRLPKLQGRDVAFGSYVFTSARHACYDLIERQKRAEPSDQIPESSIPVGGGVGGGFGFDPGDPEDDPERRLLLAAGQEEIRAANATLPERQREVLALRELEDLSYDEIAEVMEMNRNSVAQLISRARISLRDALRGTALASIATSSPDCERAVALLAAKQDRQRAAEGDWLAGHLIECETCRLSREAMEEAGVSYRAWLPIAAAPRLFRETMAEAAEAAGKDWSDVIERREAGGGAASAGAGSAPSALASALRRRRRAIALIGALALVLVVVVFAGATGDAPPADEPVPVADEVPAAPAAKPDEPKAKPDEPKRKPDGDEQSPPAAGDPAEPATGDEQPDEPDSPSGGSDAPPAANAPTEQTDRGARRPRPESRGRNPGTRDGTESPASDPTPPEPPPTEQPPTEQPPTAPPPEQPPPEQPPTEQPPRDPPSSEPTGCRDANGLPIPCPPSRPPQPPPRLAPPPRQP
jgi:RNA polymerase sigma factor (sigma-70 family)